jgi:hypothetical protein
MADNDFRYTIPAEHLPATVISIKTSKDKSMSDGDELLEYEYVVKREGYVDDDKTALIARRGEIRATKDGVVEDIHVTKGQVIENDRYSNLGRAFDARPFVCSCSTSIALFWPPH